MRQSKWSIVDRCLTASRRLLHHSRAKSRHVAPHLDRTNAWMERVEWLRGKNMNEVVLVTVAYGLRLARMRPRAVMHVASSTWHRFVSLSVNNSVWKSMRGDRRSIKVRDRYVIIDRTYRYTISRQCNVLSLFSFFLHVIGPTEKVAKRSVDC